MSLEELRGEIDAINRRLVDLLAQRVEIAREIAKVKKQESLPILDPEREKRIREEMMRLAKEQKLSALVVDEIFEIILETTRLEMETV